LPSLAHDQEDDQPTAEGQGNPAEQLAGRREGDVHAVSFIPASAFSIVGKPYSVASRITLWRERCCALAIREIRFLEIGASRRKTAVGFSFFIFDFMGTEIS